MSDQGAGQERSSHLPLPGVNLIGRAAERKAIGSAIDNGSRLITLTGPGGIGKSALALATARDLESRFSGGAWFVPLAGLRFPQLLESEIGRVLGMHEPSDGAMQDALCARLASSRTLLILDNFSHLHEAIPVIEALIDRSPDLHMVVTSRSPLGITGEQVLPVPPLTTPVESSRRDIERLRNVESVQLFISRLTASVDFELTVANAPVVATICQLLGGAPLSIELAAGQCVNASPEELEEDLALETAASPDPGDESGADRLSIPATIAWCVERLEAPHQQLLGRLAICVGGFDHHAAVELAAHALNVDARQGLAALRSAGLVREYWPHVSAQRFGLPEPVRECMLRQLEAAGELDSIRMAHARHYLTLAEKAESRLSGPDRLDALEWFDIELGNLRSAVATLMRATRPYLARSSVRVLWKYWWIRRRLLESQRWLEAAIARFDTENPDELEPELRFAAAALALSRQDVQSARRHATEGIAISRQLGADFWHAALLAVLGQAAQGAGDLDRALHLYTLFLKTIAPMRKGNPLSAYLEAAVNLSASTAYLARGEIADAEFHASEGLSRFLRIGDKWGIGLAKLQLAAIAAAQENLDAALELYQESLPILAESGDVGAVAEGLVGLARIAAGLGRREIAARLIGAAESLRSIGPVSYALVAPVSTEDILARLAELANAESLEKWKREGSAQAQVDVGSLIEEAIEAIQAKRQSGPSRGKGRTGPESLSRRELEVLCLIVEGMTDQQIADARFISYRTVTSHVEHIFGKLGVNNRSSAVAYAIRHDLC